MKYPADFYKPSTRPYRGIGELSYPFHDRIALVTCCGRICIYKKKINLSTSLAGQAVGIKEVDEGIWLVSFMDYDLGYIDLEEKTLQPLRTKAWNVAQRRCRIAPAISAMGFVVFFFALVCVVSAQQGKPTISSTPDHVAPLRVTTRLVQINVIVDDKHGNPITGLAKEDFALLDDKELQKIQFFEEQGNRPPNQSSSPLPPDTFTNRMTDAASTPESVTVILLDAINTEFADQVLARNQVVKFLRQIQPGDRVALYWLGNSLHVLHDFTTDASILRETLAGFAGESSENLADSKVEDPSLNNPNSALPAGQTSSRETFRQAFAQRTANESTNDRVRLTVAALTVIAHHIGSLKGRKNLVWVSASFPFSLGNERFDMDWTNDTGKNFSGDIASAAQALTDANIAVYPVDARGLMGDEIRATQDSSDAHPEFSSEGDEQLPTHVAPGNTDTMKILAERTGGKAFYGTNDLSGSIRRAVDDSRATYTLSYYPANQKWDGRFHTIKVKVKTPGANVRARTGYFAIPASTKAPSKTAQAMVSQAALSQLDATGIDMRVQVHAANAPEPRSIIVNIQLDLHQIRMERVKSLWAGAVQSVFLQLNKNGEIIHVDDETFKLSLPAPVYEQTLTSGVRETERIEILSSAERLCIVLRDPSNDNLGSITIPVGRYSAQTPKAAN